jgi:protein-S-isoprenylcysteine O-methyltransferase Ste14
MFYLLKKDPGLLERRLRGREKERGQSLLAWVSSPFYLALLILPGFDYRFGWSEVPVPLILAADILFLAGYALFFRVLMENTYLSRVVEVESDQAVIDTGPYSLVRHPMYVAVLAMFAATPVALGSWWGLLAAAPVPLFLVLRIRGEEKLMRENLPGYLEYCGKVRFRLFPGIW